MKTWIDKRDSEKSYIIKTIDKKFASEEDRFTEVVVFPTPPF